MKSIIGRCVEVFVSFAENSSGCVPENARRISPSRSEDVQQIYIAEIIMSGINSNLRARTVSVLVGFVCTLAWPTIVFAQLEEITVTAEKRQESLQDVGVAVSAYTGDELEKRSIREARDLFDRLPNVSMQSNSSDSQAQVSIRGLSFPTFVPTGVQPVGIFQDEINLNSPQVTGLSLFDLERVEVVRGPQNTLYGRNTTGGAVNYISRKPKIGAGTSGRFSVGYGKNNQIDVDGAVGFDLSDTTAGRLAISSRTRDGIYRNTFLNTDDTERDKIGLRGQLLFEPNDGIIIAV